MKIYAAPAIVTSADVVRETKTVGTLAVNESSFTKHINPGTVGFYL
jgi:hypothetical protein